MNPIIELCNERDGLKEENAALKKENELLEARMSIRIKRHSADVIHMSGWSAPLAPNELKEVIAGLRERVLAYDADVTRGDAAEAQLGKVKNELDQAHTCLEEYGDVDYPEMTQGGNQGLRHVDQALAIIAETGGEDA